LIKGQSNKKNTFTSPKNDYANLQISKDLNQNTSTVLSILQPAYDISCRHFSLGSKNKIECVLIFFNTIVDVDKIDNNILNPLLNKCCSTSSDEDLFKTITQEILSSKNILVSIDMEVIIQSVLKGFTLLFVQGFSQCIMIDTQKIEARKIDESNIEPIIKGAKDSFNESLKTNISLLRSIIKDPALKMTKLTLGRVTKTDIAIVYIENISKEEIVKDVIDRLSIIDTDSILESKYLEEYLETNPYSIFPQVDITERPDKTAGNLLEGKIAIFTDRTPIVMIVPCTFVQFFHSTEDYFQRTIYSNMFRLFRFFSGFLSTCLPAIYVSLVSFHPQLIPLPLINVLQKGRESLPFPSIVEVFIMLFFIDIMQEASTRLMSKFGQSIGIVGSIVLGEAAVAANLASPSTLIIISLTMLASLVFSRFPLTFAFRILRYLYIISAQIAGIYGLIISLLFTLIHLCSLESLKNPYLIPLAPFKLSQMQDALFISRIKGMTSRPSYAKKGNAIRRGN
jgi:hypothetical protein